MTAVKQTVHPNLLDGFAARMQAIVAALSATKTTKSEEEKTGLGRSAFENRATSTKTPLMMCAPKNMIAAANALHAERRTAQRR